MFVYLMLVARALEAIRWIAPAQLIQHSGVHMNFESWLLGRVVNKCATTHFGPVPVAGQHEMDRRNFNPPPSMKRETAIAKSRASRKKNPNRWRCSYRKLEGGTDSS